MMIAILILSIALILIMLCLYVLHRNNKVYHFNVSLGNFLFDEMKRILNTYKDDNEFHQDEVNYNYIKEKVQLLLDKHSYDRYLYSFNPLKLEKWFTEEELEFMKYLKQYRV
jgi:hypothetical protein